MFRHIFRLYPPRADCMDYDPRLIFISAWTDALVAFLLILIGTLILTSRSHTTSTKINRPLGLLLILLGCIFLGFLVTIWIGVYWVVAGLKLLVWPLAIWTIIVLPVSIKQRRANDQAVNDMKTKIDELEKLKDDVTKHNNS